MQRGLLLAARWMRRRVALAGLALLLVGGGLALGLGGERAAALQGAASVAGDRAVEDFQSDELQDEGDDLFDSDEFGGDDDLFDNDGEGGSDELEGDPEGDLFDGDPEGDSFDGDPEGDESDGEPGDGADDESDDGTDDESDGEPGDGTDDESDGEPGDGADDESEDGAGDGSDGEPGDEADDGSDGEMSARPGTTTTAPPAATGPPRVSVIPGERGVTQPQITWARETMTDAVELFQSRWSVAGLPSVRVQIHVTRWAQRNALRHVLGDPSAPELHWCSQPYRTAPGARWTIAYLFGCSRSNFVLAHEYMRIVQNETGSREANLLEAPLWLTHGSAEWVESIFESQHGGRAYATSQAINRRAALVARETYALHDPSMCAECAPHYAAYTMGFVAVERLAELVGEEAIFAFWPRLKQAYEAGEGFEEAFEATFGISLARFYATFDIHLRGQRSWMVIS